MTMNERRLVCLTVQLRKALSGLYHWENWIFFCVMSRPLMDKEA